jgi:3,4-dihydroxy 2-butanone 4-phosphate synthase / GTP cyclohydrolase II
MKTAGVGRFLLAGTAAAHPDAATLANLPSCQMIKTADGGQLENAEMPEAAVDLARLAGLAPQALLRALQPQDLWAFAKHHGLPVVTVAELALYRRRTEAVLELVAVADLPTRHASLPFRAHSFRSSFDAVEHLALVSPGEGKGDPLVRIHSECLTGDAFGSLRCDCGPQLDESMRRIAASPGGVLIYMRGHEGRGIGLSNKMRAYALQDKGLDTVQANRALGLPEDARDFAHAAQILRMLGHGAVRLLTNNPEKAASLQRHKMTVSQIEPLVIPPNPFNARYLDTKALKFDHTLPVQWHLG